MHVPIPIVSDNNELNPLEFVLEAKKKNQQAGKFFGSTND